jgi:hypothetical protein
MAAEDVVVPALGFDAVRASLGAVGAARIRRMAARGGRLDVFLLGLLERTIAAVAD